MAEVPATNENNSAARSGGMVSMDPDNRLRADTYRLLGRLLATPPDADLLANLAAAPVTEDNNLLAVAWRLLASSASRATATQVSDEYQALFIGLGRGELVSLSWGRNVDRDSLMFLYDDPQD